MVFANLLFIYLFLPLNILFYFLSKKLVYRNLVLVAFSFLFYAWGEPVWFLLLLTSAAFDYMHGRLIERYGGPGRPRRRSPPRWRSTSGCSAPSSTAAFSFRT